MERCFCLFADFHSAMLQPDAVSFKLQLWTVDDAESMQLNNTRTMQHHHHQSIIILSSSSSSSSSWCYNNNIHNRLRSRYFHTFFSTKWARNRNWKQTIPLRYNLAVRKSSTLMELIVSGSKQIAKSKPWLKSNRLFLPLPKISQQFAHNFVANEQTNNLWPKHGTGGVTTRRQLKQWQFILVLQLQLITRRTDIDSLWHRTYLHAQSCFADSELSGVGPIKAVDTVGTDDTVLSLTTDCTAVSAT